MSDRLLTFESLIRCARLIFYPIPLILVPAAFYASGLFSDVSSLFSSDWLVALLIPILIGEIVSVVLTEIYFKVFYSAAVRELKTLLRQLDFEE